MAEADAPVHEPFDHVGVIAEVRGRAAVFWAGAALALTGVAAVVFPTIAPVVIGALAGWVLWFAGATMLLVALITRGAGSFFGALATSLLAIAAGVYLLLHPSAGALAASILLTAVLMLDGASQIALALDLRPLRAWRWVLGSALASIVAGVLIVSGAPGRSTLALSVIVGFAFMTSGLAFMMIGRANAAAPGSSRR